MNKFYLPMLSILRYCTFIVMLLNVFPVIANDEDPPTTSFDGLEMVNSDKYSHVYIKPGMDFRMYHKIILAPSKVAFKSNWKRKYNSSTVRGLSGRVTDKDMRRIIESLSKLFDEVFHEELKKVKGFSLADEAGEDVLLIKPAIINLDVNAPEVTRFAHSRTYVDYAGEGTLYLEIYDSLSGQILARIVETRKTRDHTYYKWADRVTNMGDARALLRHWAERLRIKLDEVHASKKK